jgi:hypothetical protein
VLKPVVQVPGIDIFGLNGAKKSSEKTKWGICKKKDLVDSILVQELREEEPEWVNYDDDKLAVKMQLTETIFNDLLTDTVETMNKSSARNKVCSSRYRQLFDLDYVKAFVICFHADAFYTTTIKWMGI